MTFASPPPARTQPAQPTLGLDRAPGRADGDGGGVDRPLSPQPAGNRPQLRRRGRGGPADDVGLLHRHGGRRASLWPGVGPRRPTAGIVDRARRLCRRLARLRAGAGDRLADRWPTGAGAGSLRRAGGRARGGPRPLSPPGFGAHLLAADAGAGRRADDRADGRGVAGHLRLVADHLCRAGGVRRRHGGRCRLAPRREPVGSDHGDGGTTRASPPRTSRCSASAGCSATCSAGR